MSLAPGVRLGPYEILSPLGAGGMGEVYRARDTRLMRDVAIKVLPEHLSANPQVRARFEREAKAISSLNHPNICTLFDVGQDAGTDYLVMELVEGETLAARLQRGALPTAEVLRIAGQIAAALDQAHRAGVVHRDLKPGNVMLTRSGAKLMDFGLAKGAGSGSASPRALTAAPTATSPLTAEGALIGTFKYMAPEQFEGREADARTDLFALGLVIYEMAAGRPAFDGRTQASLIAAILKDEPPPIASTTTMSPPALDRLVRLCLRKDPDERLQSAHDVRLRIEEIGEAGTAVATGASPGARGRSAWRERIAWGIAALASALAIALAAGVARGPAPPAPVMITSIPAPPGGTFVQSTLGLGLSPDGRSLAFVARSPEGNGLFVRSFGEPKARLLFPSEDAGCPFWSPDGKSIGFVAGGQLQTIPLAGGETERLAAAKDCYGGFWGADGSILYVADRYSPIMRIAGRGAEPTAITFGPTAEAKRIYSNPSLLPDRRHLLYTVNDSLRGGTDSGIYLGTIDGKEERRLLSVLSNARYVAPGFLLYGREGVLRAQRFDPGRLALEGDATPLFEGVQYLGFYQNHLFAVSESGLLAYVEGNRNQERQFTWVDRHGAVLGTLMDPGNYFSPRFSHDGKRVAFDLSDPTTDSGDIWVLDLGRGVPTRLTFDPRNESGPVWSPDDRRLAFFMNTPGRGDIALIASDGRGEREPILSAEADQITCDWSRDGKSILVQSNSISGRQGTDLLLVSPSERKATPWLATPFVEKQARFSPDGRWIAYDSDESGRMEVYVRPADAGGGKWRISSAGGESAVWNPDGGELFYLSPGSEMMSVTIGRGPTFESGAPTPLFTLPGEVLNLGVVTQYDVAPDGRRFLLNLNKATQGKKMITLVSNWMSFLARR